MGAVSTRVYLVRHGAVDQAWEGHIYGSVDVPLSELGRRESRRTAEALAPVWLDAVVSSGLERTRFMAARILEGRSLPSIEDSELRELDRGTWAGMPIRELQRRSPGAWETWMAAPARTRPPGGESLEDLRERLLPRMDHWCARHPGGTIALVAHGWVLRVLVCHVLDAPLSLAPRLDVRTGDLTCLRWPAQEVADRAALRLEGFACAGALQFCE